MSLMTSRLFSNLPSLSSLLSPARVLTRTPIPVTDTPHTPFSSRSSHSSSSPPPITKMGAVPPSSFEASIKRNPHPDFKKVESSRPAFDTSSYFRYTQTPNPSWTPGSGANTSPASPSSQHISIDPSAPGRPSGSNYKLLISAVVPRPIAFVSTLSADGAVANLAPFSYFQLVAHDPPMFVIGFACPLDAARSKDTLRNLAATGECVINIISESYVEAANATSVNAPPDVSEWDVAGLTAVYDCEGVKCARVAEAVFSVECRLDSLREFDSRAKPGTKSGTLAVVEGTRFWVREDAVDEGATMVDPAVLRPVSRLGGITYGRTTEAFELPRPDFEKDMGGRAAVEALKRKREGGETLQ